MKIRFIFGLGCLIALLAMSTVASADVQLLTAAEQEYSFGGGICMEVSGCTSGCDNQYGIQQVDSYAWVCPGGPCNWIPDGDVTCTYYAYALPFCAGSVLYSWYDTGDYCY